MNYEVYMHGQILGTHSFLLKGEFLQPDEYSELKAKYFLFELQFPLGIYAQEWDYRITW